MLERLLQPPHNAHDYWRFRTARPICANRIAWRVRTRAAGDNLSDNLIKLPGIACGSRYASRRGCIH